ncbi:MAG TPA: transporter, partial [Acidimicrobiia bacterium]|nr:transporter [Acidimicrobiia bacterium]
MATPFIGHVSTATATSPASKYTPKYAPTPCTDDRLPIDRTHIDCGTLTVPENRRKPNGRQVHLPVAILRSTAANKQPDPIVYLVGGPGVGGLTPATVFYDSGIVTDRDLILIDPRGTGRATPSLACTETQHVAEQSAAASESPSAAAARYERAFAQCVGRVRRSADLAQYNTPTNALDADDLRTALG